MKFLKKKIFLAGMAAMALLVATVASTFAWFSLNDSAWVDGFELSIDNSDDLLIGYEGSAFKEGLTNADLVEAINSMRPDGEKIAGLNDISLTPITTFDAISFKRQVSVFDDRNVQSIEYANANINSYVEFKLIFTVEVNRTSTHHPDYELTFKIGDVLSSNVKSTSFRAEVQNLTLLNSLVTLEGSKVKGDELKVNPVNALRMAVVGSQAADSTNHDLDFIYEVANENDLGSYAFDERVLAAIKADALNQNPNADIGIYDNAAYNSSTNAMFTYFNNINNGCLKPMGYFENDLELESSKEDVRTLLSKLRNDLKLSLGTLSYDATTESYNQVELTFKLWIDGFDADNLIGLNTSKIACLLSFDISEVLE